MSDEVDEQDVEILESFSTGERYRERESTGVVQHQRQIPLPLRVRSGTIKDDCLELEGSEIPWDQVRMFSLGVVHHSLGNMEPPKTMVRQMFGKLMGKDDRSEKKVARHQEFVIFDIYVASQDAPFRLDSANVNYRAFLGSDLAFISMHNFYRLAVRLARKATAARLNDNAVAFLQRRREQVRSTGAVYDFELESQGDLLTRYDSLKSTQELDLSRDNYADEMEEE